MRKFEGMKKVLSAVLALCMVLSYAPVTAFAVTEDGSCEHHTHDESCGYVAMVEGVDCGHKCSDACKTKEVTSCTHNHEAEGCTYTPAAEAVACDYVHGEGCNHVYAQDEVLCTCGAEPQHTAECASVLTEGAECNCTPTVTHAEGCDPQAAVAESCDHVHGDCAYREAVEESWSCGHVCSVENGCITFVCAHVCPEDNCGFMAAVEGSDCTFVCEECSAEPEATVLTITGWSWVDEYEILSEDGAYITLPNAADWETLKSVLPTITATVDGAEVTVPVQWECENFPAEGAAQGTFQLKAVLPEGYALGEGVAALELEVNLGVADDLDTIATIASGTCGTNVNWVLDSDGVLTISGTGKMTDYPQYQNTPWYDYRSNIKSIVIEDGVTSIGNNAFYWCSALTTVTVMGNITKIGSSSFRTCSQLTTVTVMGNVNEIGSSAFQDSSKLTNVTFKGDVGTIASKAFNSSTSTLNLTIDGDVTSFSDKVFNFRRTTLTLNYNGTTIPTNNGDIYEGWNNSFKIYVTPAYYAQSSFFCNIGVVRPVLNITVDSDESKGTAVAQYNGNPVTSLGMKLTATLVATPADGYYLKEYQVISGDITIDEKKQFTVGQENIEIKAIFEALPEGAYTVSFNANGGTGNMDMIAVKGGEAETLPQNLFKMTYYNFKEWNTEVDGSGKSYADKAEISITENTTLYAQWEKITYSVTYDANGGTGIMETETVEASGSNNYTFPECSFTAPEGGVFAGWKYGTRTYNPGANIKITKDITVTAQWNIPAAAVTIDGTTTTYGTLELAAAAVEGKTATVKLLDDVTLTDRLTFKAENLTLDLNNKTISNYYLTLYNTVSITGPGTLQGHGMWLDIEQNATVTINEGVAITKNSTAIAIDMKYGSTLILNGGRITISDTTSVQIGGGTDSTVVVNADGVTIRFNRQNVYYNISPATEPTINPIYKDGKIWYKIDNQIDGAIVTATESATYGGNTYAAKDATVTVSKTGLSDCYYNGVAATKNEDGTFTFTMPAAVATIKDVPDHSHSLSYSAQNAVITEKCDSCTHEATATITIPADADLYFTGNPITPAEVTCSSGWLGGELTVDYSNNVYSGSAKAFITKNDAKAEKQFTISYYAPAATVSCERNEEGWAKSATLTAPEGHLVSLTRDGAFGSSVSLPDAESNRTIEYYIRTSESNTYKRYVSYNKVDSVEPGVNKTTVTDVTHNSATVTITANNRQYGSINPSPVVQYTLYLGETEYKTNTTGVFELTDLTANQTYTLGYSIMDAAGNVYNGTSDNAIQFTTALAAAVTTPPTVTLTYGETLAQATVTGGETTVEGTFSFKEPTTAPAVADSNKTEYTLIFMPTDTESYDPVEIEVTVTVNPKEIGITWGNTTLTYNASEQAPTATATDIVNGDAITLTVDGAKTNAGTGYTATVTGITGDKAGNYKLPTDVTKTFEIENASQTAPTVTGVNETVANKADGKITGVNSTMEYCKDGESTYTAITETEVTDLAAGIYYVRYAAKDNYDASPNTTVEIGTGRKLTVTIPTEQTGYTLTADTTEVNYGGSVTLTYSLADGYTAGENFAVTATNCTVTNNGDGTYTLSNITDNVVVSVTGVQDVTAPTANINITTNNWNTFLNTITFGKYFNATQTVTITASDAGSGMSKIYYYLASEAMTLEQVQDITDWTEYSEAFSIDPDNQYVIYAKAVDNDGNTVWISSEGIVLDKTTPTITGVTNNGVYYTTQKVTATDNTTLDTLTLNGTTFDGTIPGDPAQETKHTIVATDKAGNSTTVTVMMKPIRALAEATNDLTNDNVTSANTPALEALVEKLDELLADDDVTDGERETLEQHKAIAESLIQTIEDTAAEQKAVTDKAAEFDEDAVKSTDKAELEKLAEDIDALLDTNNLTQDERTALVTLLEQVEGMTHTIDKTAADSKTATDAIDALDPETVKSTDKAAVEAALETIENLLDGDHLTEDERKALEDAKADAEALLAAIDEAAKAADTENTSKVEDVTADNVTPEDKSDLEDAKADLEKALEDNSGNYTEEEKKAIEDEIARIDEALQIIENVEAVEDTISDFPATVEPDDEETVAEIEDAKKAYDELTEYEKSLVDEDTKKKLDDLTAAAVAYKIVKGDNGKWTKGGTSGLSFTANGPLGKFSGVEIDGKVIDAKYYDAVAGSTVITLKASYLETLSTGKHTITVVYTDGEAEGTFKINAKSVTPATGDNSDIMLWSGMLCISTLGLVVLLADRKRRRSPK